MAIQIFEENLVKIFILVLNMTLTGSVVILAVLLARILFKKAPRIFSYALWAVVLFRLLSPVSFSLPVSLLGALQNEPARGGRMEYIAEDIGYMERPQIALPVPGLSETVNDVLPLADRTASVNPMQVYMIVGAYIWLLGILSMAIYSAISLRRLQRRLKEAVFEKENIYRIKGAGSPFVFGLFRPRIYLPEKISAEEERYILLHEQIHIQRGDAAFRLLAYLALWLHWFNPLVWGAFALSGRDMEMSCDETVIRRMGSGVKKEYSASLLNAASGKQIVKGIPLAFGESDTGSRIKNVLRYQKPAALLVGGGTVLGVILALIFLANPAKAKENGNVFYSVATEAAGEDGAPETVVRMPRFGDVPAPAEAMREEEGAVLYADSRSVDTGSEIFSLSPERLRNRELLDGMYVVHVRSISRSARGFDLYVTDAETEDLPLFPFAEDCEFRVNWETDRVSYSPVSFDKFADLVTQSVRVINPPVYCEVVDSQIVRADLESGYYLEGFTYAMPTGSSFDFGDSYRYDDEMFRSWADNLAYYLENSYLVLSSQDGEIRTERVSEADRYNYETLKREL